MRKLQPIAKAAAMFMAAAFPAKAFGTLDGWGQHAEHRSLTFRALGCGHLPADECWEPKSLRLLAGGPGGGAVGVPDRTSLAWQASAHCDNGDDFASPTYPRSAAHGRNALVACRLWIASSLNAAIAAAANLLDAEGRPTPDSPDCGGWFWQTRSAKCAVLLQFGRALHASQDFYAHTNWVDRPDPERPISLTNPPGLARSRPSAWLSLTDNTAFPPGLISGCFENLPESWFCGHGERTRVRHADLNKDEGLLTASGAEGLTPRGAKQANFERATTAATLDTQQKWRLFELRLRQTYGARSILIICLLRRDQAAACTS